LFYALVFVLVFFIASVHSVPYPIEEQFSQSSSIFRMRLVLLESNELRLELIGASPTFLKVVVHIAIRVCQTQGSYGGGKIPPKPSAALAVTAFHARKANFVVLDLASTSGPILFCEAASLHLFHEQKQVIGDEILVVRPHYPLWLVRW
jgi:hypothetical protein